MPEIWCFPIGQSLVGLWGTPTLTIESDSRSRLHVIPHHSMSLLPISLPCITYTNCQPVVQFTYDILMQSERSIGAVTSSFVSQLTSIALPALTMLP